MSVCPCQCRAEVKRRRWTRGFAWLAPTIVLALTPKCPACVVAYAAVLTGLGLSLTTAAYLRMGAIAVAVIALSWLVASAVWRRVRHVNPAA